MKSKHSIYLAGPDVFFPDVKERFARLNQLAKARKLSTLEPSDEGISGMIAANVPPKEIAKNIYLDNVNRIRQSHAVLANMMPFRGEVEPDSGTVFEVGMAIALGKPVALYLPQGVEDSGGRIKRLYGQGPDGKDARYGALIEDFGLPLNLMLSCSSSCFATPEEGLDYLAEALKLKDRMLTKDDTTWMERFRHSLTLMCGAEPPLRYCEMWINNEQENNCDPLQNWVGVQTKTPSWAQNIGTIDAAHVWADSPVEGENHRPRLEAANEACRG